MKQFFGAFFGSLIGLLIATVLGVFLLVAMLKSGLGSVMNSRGTETTVLTGKTILRLDLEGEIIERERENPFSQLADITPMVDGNQLGLNTLIRKIKGAAKDDKITGIYLRFKDLRGGIASLAELRKALLDFRASGKYVYSYSENFTQGQYYLASVSDRVFLNPEGSIAWKGLAMNMLFFRNAFDKLNIEMQIFRHGKFKSAVEPFILEKMSEANRLQSEVFLNSIWHSLLKDIAASRKVPVEELNAMANNLTIRFAEDALGTLIDQVAYEDEVLDILRQKSEVTDSKKSIPFVKVNKYHAKPGAGVGAGRIAVVYANGPITSGDGRDEEAGSDRICKALKEARENDKIKAIVLRVNSPGGSALASDVIWREMLLTKKDKPVVVSMGDVAASGGYYISCAADRIFAQPNTITGSIGVFGVLPNFGKLLEHKIGITTDTVNTNKYSDIASGLRAVTPAERDFVQASVERVYEVFTSKVAQGRNISQASVDSMGQGRVWSGSDALKLNLVDELGGLSEAVAYAAEKAGLKDYRITELPKLKGPFDGIFNTAEKEVEQRVLSGTLGAAYPYFKQLQDMVKVSGVQARLPFTFLIE